MKQNKMTVGYTRCAFDDAGIPRSETMEVQQEDIEVYALVNGYCLGKIYEDSGVSGLSYERNGFVRMMEDAKKGQFVRVLMTEPSRLGRDISRNMDAVRELESLGIEIVYTAADVETAGALKEVLEFLTEHLHRE